MTRRLAAAVLVLALPLAACSTLDAINPFAKKSGPKMAELQPISATTEARVEWREGVGKSELYVFTPAVVGSSVYAAGENGTVLRIDEGRVVWKANAEQVLSGGVGANADIVVVGSRKGDVLAFAAADGKLLWKAKASSEILAPPAVGEGLVVVRSSDSRVTGYSASDGQRKWVYQRPAPALALRFAGQPLIDGKYVFVGFPGGKLVALLNDNGTAVWDGTVALPKGATETDRIADISSAPVISGRTICAVAYQGRVACFDLGNGSLVWARDMSSARGMTVDQRYVYVTDDKGAVHALDLATGSSIWKQDKLFLRGVTAPAVARGLVVVADVQGVVHFLNRDDGSFAARVTTDGSPVVAPLRAAGNALVLQTRNGGVFAVAAQ
ncbi:outer membrane protein assembly factor BamB [Propionivibrio soli]|uniref:outer membrane protein assembly factor BamB n=1 Tax=Propionivibrio soli TaxID=2976531 RepID=UPI0021E822DD|nr:outer membrane protein assembly factor BamB [Propionivibrio soli]